MSPEATMDKRARANENTQKRKILIDEYAKKNQLVQLSSDYYGCTLYYYQPTTKTMYEVNPICEEWNNIIEPTFTVSNDAHILALNRLT